MSEVTIEPFRQNVCRGCGKKLCTPDKKSTGLCRSCRQKDLVFDMEPVKVYGKDEPEWRIKPTPENCRRLERYVLRKLLASGVIPEDEANPENPYSIASHIVADAWRQYDKKYYADMGIERAIKHPPEPISDKRFSLEAFVKQKT